MSSATTRNPAVAKAMFSSASDDWPTPKDFYDQLDAEFGFVLDACASTTNHKAPHYYALDHADPTRRDGLAGDWAADARVHGGSAFCNPPYGAQIGAWMARAAQTARDGATVVCLVPARTDTRWFHDHVLAEGAEVRFVRGRLKFGNAKTGAPFASLVIIYRPQSAATTAPRPSDAPVAVAPVAGAAGARQAAACPVRRPGLALVAGSASGNGNENTTSGAATGAGTVLEATDTRSPRRTVRVVTTSNHTTASVHFVDPTSAHRDATNRADTAAMRQAAATARALRAAAKLRPPTPALLTATDPTVVLALGTEFTQARKAAGNRSAVSDASIVNKHLYWLATGRLPVKSGRSFDLATITDPEPGWTLLAPAAVNGATIKRYRIVTMQAGVADSTREKETTILSVFYAWLRGEADNPVLEFRDPERAEDLRAGRTPRKKPNATTKRGPGTRAAVLRFYTHEEARRLLAAAATRLTDTGASCATTAWVQRARVEQECTWLMWGTGATPGALAAVETDDVDLVAGTITWRDADGQPVRTQPLPRVVADRLTRYLHEVRPQLPAATTSRRLLLNPFAQTKDKAITPRFLQELTKALAATAGLSDDPRHQRHTPTTWTHTHAMRLLESQRGTLVAVMALHGQRNYASVERTYGHRLPAKDPVAIRDVFDEPAPTMPAAAPAAAQTAASAEPARCLRVA